MIPRGQCDSDCAFLNYPTGMLYRLGIALELDKMPWMCGS